jgi:signal transduction histidine kinase
MLKQAMEQGAFYKVTREYTAKKWQQERAILEAEGASEMLLLAIKPPVGAKLIGSKPPMGFIELFYRRPPPEVTQEFRHRLRATVYEVAEALAANPTPIPATILHEAAEMILTKAEADWLKLWLVSTDGTMKRVMEYGTAVYLAEPFPLALLDSPCRSVLRDTSKTANLDHRDSMLSETTRLYMNDLGAKTMLCVPLHVKGELFGVVAAYDTLGARHFRSEEMRLVQGLVTQAATAIDNANLYSGLQRSMEDLKHAQAKLVETARLSAIGELAAVVAHQINNPLTTVIADADVLLQDLTADHPMHEGVAAIHRAGRRSLAVVKRLLSTARREPGEEPHPVNLNDTIASTLELVMVYIERRGIVVEVELDPTPTYVWAKRGYLEDIWLNLLMNARDALDGVAAARIVLSSRLGEGEIEVTVHDNGPGVPPQYHENIFNPFFTTKPPGEGTGLGLYICRQISEECQGRIVLDTSVPQGACFRVYLPLTEPESFAT